MERVQLEQTENTINTQKEEISKLEEQIRGIQADLDSKLKEMESREGKWKEEEKEFKNQIANLQSRIEELTK